MLCFQNHSVLSGYKECGTTYGVSPKLMCYGKGGDKKLSFMVALVTMLPCTAFTSSRLAMYKTNS